MNWLYQHDHSCWLGRKTSNPNQIKQNHLHSTFIYASIKGSCKSELSTKVSCTFSYGTNSSLKEYGFEHNFMYLDTILTPKRLSLGSTFPITLERYICKTDCIGLVMAHKMSVLHDRSCADTSMENFNRSRATTPPKSLNLKMLINITTAPRIDHSSKVGENLQPVLD